MKDIKNKRINVNYVITESIKINNIEYVLGKHQLTEKYVTWYYANKTYYYGHYIDDYKTAKIDLYNHVIDEMEYLKGEFQNRIKYLEKGRNNENK